MSYQKKIVMFIYRFSFMITGFLLSVSLFDIKPTYQHHFLVSSSTVVFNWILLRSVPNGACRQLFSTQHKIP